MASLMRPEDVFDLEGFGRALHAVRRGRGLTQRQVADESGVSFNTVSRLERARIDPSVSTLISVARWAHLAIDPFVNGWGEASDG